MKRTIFILIGIALCLVVGLTAHCFQSDSIGSWYQTLVKPEITPPNILFPFAWGIIYICTGISAGLIWGDRNAPKFGATILFALQLLFSFAWSICFFYLRNPMLGFADIIALDITVLLYLVHVSGINRASAWLTLPYITWLALATYLNGFIMMHN